jgi:hypothetical protein
MNDTKSDLKKYIKNHKTTTRLTCTGKSAECSAKHDNFYDEENIIHGVAYVCKQCVVPSFTRCEPCHLADNNILLHEKYRKTLYKHDADSEDLKYKCMKCFDKYTVYGCRSCGYGNGFCDTCANNENFVEQHAASHQTHVFKTVYPEKYDLVNSYEYVIHFFKKIGPKKYLYVLDKHNIDYDGNMNINYYLRYYDNGEILLDWTIDTYNPYFGCTVELLEWNDMEQTATITYYEKHSKCCVKIKVIAKKGTGHTGFIDFFDTWITLPDSMLLDDFDANLFIDSLSFDDPMTSTYMYMINKMLADEPYNDPVSIDRPLMGEVIKFVKNGSVMKKNYWE